MFPGAYFDPELTGPPEEVFPSVAQFIHRANKNMFLLYAAGLRCQRLLDYGTKINVVSASICVYGPPSPSKFEPRAVSTVRDDGVTGNRQGELRSKLTHAAYLRAILLALKYKDWDGPCDLVIALEHAGVYKRLIKCLTTETGELVPTFTNLKKGDINPEQETWLLVWETIQELAKTKVKVMFWLITYEQHPGMRNLKLHPPAHTLNKPFPEEYEIFDHGNKLFNH